MTARVVTLDLDGVADKAGLMDRCVRDLRLPDWFGRNWDALADVLSDPGLWSGDGSEDAAEEETVVVVRNWDRYAGARPDEWATAREVFSQASALTVALALGGSS
ncbi:barstar family protein [Streptomyces canus]|uniref:barstar family protein n=1 Tax=Streptomyces canus TaxID=58343 RepID=UPI002E28D208|nr:barstar family protein [Streptomyces canus]